MAIWILYLLLIDVITDSSNMFYVKTNETINLNDLTTCNGWSKNYEDISDTRVSMTRNNIGFYYCTSTRMQNFIFTVDKNITFEALPVNQPRLVGDNVNLSCSVTFQSFTDVISTSSRIHNLTDFHFNSSKPNNIFNQSYEEMVTASFRLDSNGIKTYICSWTYSAATGNVKVDGEVTTNISLRVYMPPTNVRPNETTAQANTTVLCLSEADPASSYSWGCVNGGWSSNASAIIFHELGNYNCTCVAKNDIGGTMYTSEWTGVIKAVSKEEYGRSLSQGGANIAAIVLGTLGGLAVVAAVVGVLVWKWKKVDLRKKDKNKVEAGKEPLETVENSLYAKI